MFRCFNFCIGKLRLGTLGLCLFISRGQGFRFSLLRPRSRDEHWDFCRQDVHSFECTGVNRGGAIRDGMRRIPLGELWQRCSGVLRVERTWAPAARPCDKNPQASSCLSVKAPSNPEVGALTTSPRVKRRIVATSRPSARRPSSSFASWAQALCRQEVCLPRKRVCGRRNRPIARRRDSS